MLAEFSFDPKQVVKQDVDPNGRIRIVVHTAGRSTAAGVAAIRTQKGESVELNGMMPTLSMKLVHVGASGGISLG